MLKRVKYTYVLGILLWVLPSGCKTGLYTDGHWPQLINNIESKYPNVNTISTRELEQWLTDPQRQAPILLDIRSRSEYDVSHLKNAYYAETIQLAQQALGSRPKTDPIVVYCSVGYRSAIIAEELQQQGYTNVTNYVGSIFEWANAGYPVYQQDQPAQRVHPYDQTWGVYLEEDLHPDE